MINNTVLKIKIDFYNNNVFTIFQCRCSSIDWGDGTTLKSHTCSFMEGTFIHNYNHSTRTGSDEYIITIYDNDLLVMVDEGNFVPNYTLISVYQISDVILNCNRMFKDCFNLVDVSQAKLPSNCILCDMMFSFCNNLTSILDWGDVIKLESCISMYHMCPIYEIKNTQFPSIDNVDNMFTLGPILFENNVLNTDKDMSIYLKEMGVITSDYTGNHNCFNIINLRINKVTK